MPAVKDLYGRLEPSSEAVRKGRERMLKVFLREEPDYLPIIHSDDRTVACEVVPEADYKSAFVEKEKAALLQFKQNLVFSRSMSDAQPTVRPNLGVGFLASIFGLDQEIFPDKMPWLKAHLSKKDISELELPPDISSLGLLPRALEMLSFFKEELSPFAQPYIADTQGPFDLAHLIRGDEIFLDLYDDPSFVHHLMRLSTDAYIKASLLMKERIAEPFDGGFHAAVAMAGCGVRSCEDTTTLISPGAIEEFVLPYLDEALKVFGGGWVHYCGKNDFLFDALLQMPSVRAINFGNPEMHSYESFMPKIIAADKIYMGSVPKKPGESLKGYFRRIIEPLDGERRGLILITPGGGEEDGQIKESPREVVEAWREIQDEVLK